MPTIYGIKYPDKLFEYKSEAPTVAADLATVTTYVHVIRFSNTTAGAITVTLIDKAGTPMEWYKTVSIAANSVSNERIASPLKFEDGINLVASGAGLDTYILGFSVGE